MPWFTTVCKNEKHLKTIWVCTVNARHSKCFESDRQWIVKHLKQFGSVLSMRDIQSVLNLIDNGQVQCVETHLQIEFFNFLSVFFINGAKFAFKVIPIDHFILMF